MRIPCPSLFVHTFKIPGAADLNVVLSSCTECIGHNATLSLMLQTSPPAWSCPSNVTNAAGECGEDAESRGCAVLCVPHACVCARWLAGLPPDPHPEQGGLPGSTLCPQSIPRVPPARAVLPVPPARLAPGAPAARLLSPARPAPLAPPTGPRPAQEATRARAAQCGVSRARACLPRHACVLPWPRRTWPCATPAPTCVHVPLPTCTQVAHPQAPTPAVRPTAAIRTCNGNTGSIMCPLGTKISIISAVFGSPEIGSPAYCAAPHAACPDTTFNATYKYDPLCTGNASCSIQAPVMGVDLMFNPCLWVTSYVQVNYDCYLGEPARRADTIDRHDPRARAPAPASPGPRPSLEPH